MIEIKEMISNIWNIQTISLAIITGVILLFAYKKKKIDGAGIFSAGILGVVCLIAFGAKGMWLMLMFFVSGNIVTRAGKHEKENNNISQKKRTYVNVIANGGASVIFALLYIWSSNLIYFLGLFGAMACALADTSATELGMALAVKLKKHPILFDFKKRKIEKVEIGTPGAVSLGGFFSSMIGSAIMSIPLLFWGYSFTAFSICCFAGFLGAALDSLFGCTIERQWGNKNTTHWINFTTTLIAGCMAIIFNLIIS